MSNPSTENQPTLFKSAKDKLLQQLASEYHLAIVLDKHGKKIEKLTSESIIYKLSTDFDFIDSEIENSIKNEVRKLENQLSTRGILKKQDNASAKIEVDSFNLNQIIDNVIDPHRIMMKEIAETDFKKEDVEKIKEQVNMSINSDSYTFINPSLSVIPLCANQLITVMGVTGNGKSTTVANIVDGIINNKSKLGKNPRILILSNEETEPNVYGKIIGLRRGFTFKAIEDLTEAQHLIYNAELENITKSGNIKVLGLDYASLATSSAEGTIYTLNKLWAQNEIFDVILIDYFQGFHSKKGSEQDAAEQRTVLQFLYNFAVSKHIAVVLFSQVNPMQTKPEDGKRTMDKSRTRGASMLLDKCTVIVEVVTDHTILESQFYIHKMRKDGSLVGTSIRQNFLYGRYLSPSDPRWTTSTVKKTNDEFRIERETNRKRKEEANEASRKRSQS